MRRLFGLLLVVAVATAAGIGYAAFAVLEADSGFSWGLLIALFVGAFFGGQVARVVGLGWRQ